MNPKCLVLIPPFNGDISQGYRLKKVLIEGKDFDKQGGSVWIGRGRSPPAVPNSLEDIFGGQEGPDGSVVQYSPCDLKVVSSILV